MSEKTTRQIVKEAMEIVSEDVRNPKCVRDGLVKEQSNKDIWSYVKSSWLSAQPINKKDYYSADEELLFDWLKQNYNIKKK